MQYRLSAFYKKEMSLTDLSTKIILKVIGFLIVKKKRKNKKKHLEKELGRKMDNPKKVIMDS